MMESGRGADVGKHCVHPEEADEAGEHVEGVGCVFQMREVHKSSGEFSGGEAASEALKGTMLGRRLWEEERRTRFEIVRKKRMVKESMRTVHCNL